MQNIHDNPEPIILGLDSSAATGCAAVWHGGKLLSEEYSNSGLTHSQTLLPMTDRALKAAEIKPSDLSLIAVTIGPGSFTGLRIGLSTAKGIAAVSGCKCVGLSSLEALANTVTDDGLICAVSDARCKRVYNALFERKNGVLIRLCDDKTTECTVLGDELETLKKQVILVGDGAKICFDAFGTRVDTAVQMNTIRGAALCSLGELKSDKAVDYKSLNPKYIQLPQAQRELMEKQKGV